MLKSFEKWKVEEFVAFLYMSLANADLHISQDEFDMLSRKLVKLMAEHYPHIKILPDVLFAEFPEELGEPVISNKEKVVEYLVEKFDFSKEFRRDLLIDLNDIISSDETVTPSEYDLFKYVRGIMGDLKAKK